ncbi:MAG TPA: efflux RND transporter permease subunit [Planctomycetota bacterium]|nr:efflux RND transporter permease subunit [Planctomycetota bacterium]
MDSFRPMSGPGRWVGEFARHHSKAISFVVLAVCLAGVYSALGMPSSVFPQTDFPRVVIMVDNGVMPADEMMVRVTRPIEEAMKDVPGAITLRNLTGRGSAELSVFFSWKADMVQAELYVLSRLSQIKSSLPATASFSTHRLTFSAFPVIGISLTSKTRGLRDLWDIARYDIKPRFLRLPGVARVDLVGGRTPEHHVVVDPDRLRAVHLTSEDVVAALTRQNLVASAGMHEEIHTLYLALADGRVFTPREIEDLVIASDEGRAVHLREIGRVVPGQEPVWNVVTADGVESILLNVRSQPDGSTIGIADRLNEELRALRRELPPDLRLAFYYDQSLLVRSSVRSVWEAIGFGLVLSMGILFLFLRRLGTTLIAIAVIPAAVLATLVVLKALGMGFNLMTLGGIAAAIGLIIDDAIVVVEAIHTKIVEGKSSGEAVTEAVGEILRPLVGSTIGPVLVFVPLAFLDGVPGVFFRSLAVTMVSALLASLVLAVTLTPTVAGWVFRRRDGVAGTGAGGAPEEFGPVLGLVVRIYERAARVAFRHPWLTMGLSGLVLLGGIATTLALKSDFLPELDEGGTVIDYIAPPGTSLAETDLMLRQLETILRATPEVETYSRRTGAALGFELVEPHAGDYMIKLKPGHARKASEILSELRRKFQEAAPRFEWEFRGILGDLIGDLTASPEPIEIKLFSTDLEFLKAKAPQVEETIKKVAGVVDTKSGLVVAGPSLRVRVRPGDALRFGLSTDAVASALNLALLGEQASSVVEGDRVVDIRVRLDPSRVATMADLATLPLRGAGGGWVQLSQVADIVEDPGQLELRRDDLRQDVAVTARLEGRDLGSAVAEIQEKLSRDPTLRPGMVEYGGLYLQQQDSFRNLLVVLVLAILLVFTALLVEFNSFAASVSIVFGAVLSLFGTVLALLVTGTSLNIISILGAIIGIGIVHKNGILMLDFVEHVRGQSLSMEEVLLRSGRRRLRPVLMTSLAAALGMLPLAYGIGSGADMLRPLAIAVIGALCVSVLLALVATPTAFLLLSRRSDPPTGESPKLPEPPGSAGLPS